jgi:hypothetical protein
VVQVTDSLRGRVGSNFFNFLFGNFHGQKQNLNTVVETKMSGVEIFKIFESDLSDTVIPRYCASLGTSRQWRYSEGGNIARVRISPCIMYTM